LIQSFEGSYYNTFVREIKNMTIPTDFVNGI